jgi:hypothetical protein
MDISDISGSEVIDYGMGYWNCFSDQGSDHILTAKSRPDPEPTELSLQLVLA